jgi:signal peptidase II
VRRSLLLLLSVAGIVIALDRWTKRWASSALPFNQPVPVLGEFVRFTYTRNSGIAFGLGQGTGFPYYLFSILAAIVILAMFMRGRVTGGVRQLALALIFGGALGNLWDRVLSGEVVDFIEVGVRRWYWPVFNVADSAVSIGVVLFALAWSRKPEPATPMSVVPGRAADEPDPHAPGPTLEQRGAAGPVSREGAGRPLA